MILIGIFHSDFTVENFKIVCYAVPVKKGFHMYILALNCGSSSLKYQVFDADTKSVVVGGNVEKIGLPDSFVTQKYPDGTKQKKEASMQNHNEALNVVMFMLREASVDMNEIQGVGHRVMFGCGFARSPIPKAATQSPATYPADGFWHTKYAYTICGCATSPKI